MVTVAVLLRPISYLEATPPREHRAPESSQTLYYQLIYDLLYYDSPEVGKHAEEMFVFFENFVVDDWDLDLVNSLSWLKLLFIRN